MFGHKTFLRIGELADASISGLFKEAYELEACRYAFSQEIDTKGKAQSDVRGGTITVALASLPEGPLLQWALNSRKYHDGVLVFCDADNLPLEKVYFEHAACVGMSLAYSAGGKAYANTRLTLQARRIRIGNLTFDSRWTE